MPSAVGERIQALADALTTLPLHVALTQICGALVVAAVAVEVVIVWTRRRRAQPVVEAGAALAMAAGAFVVGLAYTVVFHRLWITAGTVTPDVLVDLWRRQPLLAAIAAFVAWDLSGFVYHWVGHHTRVGWAGHRPHHTGTEFSLALALRLSWTPWHGLAHHWVLALAGWSFPTIVGCIAVSNLLQALQHTASPVRIPRAVAAVVMTPEHHRHHHALGAAAVNLGPVFTCWDRIAGTYRTGPVPAGTAYGLDATAARNPLAAEFDGWRTLLAGRVTPVPSKPCILAKRSNASSTCSTATSPTATRCAPMPAPSTSSTRSATTSWPSSMPVAR